MPSPSTARTETTPGGLSGLRRVCGSGPAMLTRVWLRVSSGPPDETHAARCPDAPLLRSGHLSAQPNGVCVLHITHSLLRHPLRSLAPHSADGVPETGSDRCRTVQVLNEYTYMYVGSARISEARSTTLSWECGAVEAKWVPITPALHAFLLFHSLFSPLCAHTFQCAPLEPCC